MMMMINFLHFSLLVVSSLPVHVVGAGSTIVPSNNILIHGSFQFQSLAQGGEGKFEDFSSTRSTLTSTRASAKSCSDLPDPLKFDFITTDIIRTKGCPWVDRKVGKRCRFEAARENCPRSCGLCSDDSTEPFYLDRQKDREANGGKLGSAKSCEWARERRTGARCQKSPTRKMCPETCGKR